jgi:hypothetical protein
VCRRGQGPDRYAQNLFLDYDHRTIDGPGKFMAEFKKELENLSGDIG